MLIARGNQKGGDNMTEGDKFDMILSEIQGMKTDIQGMKTDIQGINNRIDSLESQMKQTERVLKDEIRKECAIVLDEVERVHKILDKHKADKSVHTA